MKGPYKANNDGTISYTGNRICEPVSDISSIQYTEDEANTRVKDFRDSKMWSKISEINHQINKSTNEFFDEMNAKFTLLPLTTRMISSPGAVYGKEAIDYTTDTCPITLDWFDLKNKAFLSESSQLYLEMVLSSNDIDHAYSIYNSFRKERADSTHLSEFHHIEYEGKIDQEKNEQIISELIHRILKDLIKNKSDEIKYFLNDEQYNDLQKLADNIINPIKITYKEALKTLHKETHDPKYLPFTMKDNFGSWEEIKLTEIYGGLIVIKEFPLLEVPFYHTEAKSSPERVAKNSDFIWPGYREFVGSGERVSSMEEMENKSEVFNLPKEDYAPYTQTRSMEGYKTTSGFGIGWERLIQGILCMPLITTASQFPRVDFTLKP